MTPYFLKQLDLLDGWDSMLYALRGMWEHRMSISTALWPIEWDERFPR